MRRLNFGSSTWAATLQYRLAVCADLCPLESAMGGAHNSTQRRTQQHATPRTTARNTAHNSMQPHPAPHLCAVEPQAAQGRQVAALQHAHPAGVQLHDGCGLRGVGGGRGGAGVGAVCAEPARDGQKRQVLNAAPNTGQAKACWLAHQQKVQAQQTQSSPFTCKRRVCSQHCEINHAGVVGHPHAAGGGHGAWAVVLDDA